MKHMKDNQEKEENKKRQFLFSPANCNDALKPRWDQNQARRETSVTQVDSSHLLTCEQCPQKASVPETPGPRRLSVTWPIDASSIYHRKPLQILKPPSPLWGESSQALTSFVSRKTRKVAFIYHIMCSGKPWNISWEKCLSASLTQFIWVWTLMTSIQIKKNTVPSNDFGDFQMEKGAAIAKPPLPTVSIPPDH